MAAPEPAGAHEVSPRSAMNSVRPMRLYSCNPATNEFPEEPMSLHPYLFFTNTARAAMTRYHEIEGKR
jgi:hypothetical protein